MLLTIAAVLVVIWILGLILHIAGAFIHLVLLVALAVFIYHFVKKHANGKVS